MRTVAVSSYILVLLALFNIGDFTEADDDPIPNHIYHNCTITRNFTSNSPYEFSLNTLLYSLSSQASNNNKAFYNTSYSVETTADTIYVLFWCRGDIPTQLCQDCVEDASKRIVSECPNNKEAIIFYEECLVRYSDRYFFSTLSESLNTYAYGADETFEMKRKIIEKMLNDVLEEAAAAKFGTPKFATKEVKLNSNETLYSLAECTPDLSNQDCRKCLRDIISLFNESNGFADVGEFYFTSCNLRCQTFQFYYKGNTKPLSTGYFSSSTPGWFYYLNFSCSTTKNFTFNSTYELNLKKLLSSLVLSSNNGNMGLNNTKVIVGRNSSDTVYGLFMCRGDVSPQLCHQCMGNASQTLSSQCRFSKEAIVWFDRCFLRYSNHSFFSTVDISPKYILEGYHYNNITQNQGGFFNQLLAAMLTKVVAKATKPGANNFATEEEDNEWQNLYTLAQCTPDLSNQDCGTCLNDIKQDLILCCLGKQGGLVSYPSCNLEFETFQFYSKRNTSIVEASMPSPTPLVSSLGTAGKGRVRSRTIITLVVVFVVVAHIFFCIAFYLLRRKKRKNKAFLKENFGSESATLESLQFSLATIEAATNKFSHANKIGRGGFGEVYKGVLSDGREIAVKRLSKRSSQGAIEFKNEILLIAKLQHRNLVALLGFCLEEQEKLLVYEFVSNKSLDYFLFGSQRNRVLSWSERYKIIEGIAHGILYLHEHSRLKVIHRDLKPSNILLDDDMSPKISDFGMAKMVAITESEGSTNRIVGTYGYMAPEYAMLGQFSEKSDIFSFGVIVLEIISGKRNVSCRQSQHADGLLSYVWKQWREKRWSEILDSNLIELESHSEVIKCIHIGLLCVQENANARPSMITVVQYLSNDLIQLPFPQEPAFFIHGGMESIRELESGSGQHTNESIPCSANQVSITELHPR